MTSSSISGAPNLRLERMSPWKRTASCRAIPTICRQVVLGDVPDVDAVDGDPAVGDVVEAGHQVDQGRLPGSGGAEEADSFAWFDRQVDALDGRRVELAVGAAEGEADVLEHDTSLHLLRFQRLGVRAVLHRRDGVVRLEQPSRGGVAAEDERHHDGQERHRPDDQRKVLREGRRARRAPATRRGPAAPRTRPRR